MTVSTGAQPVSALWHQYHQNNATTGTWLNLNRATYPQQLQTPRVNAANAALVPRHVRLGDQQSEKSAGHQPTRQTHRLHQRRGRNTPGKPGITISQVIKESGTGRTSDLDLLFSGKKTMSGIPIKSSVNADQTRVDFLDLSHWDARS